MNRDGPMGSDMDTSKPRSGSGGKRRKITRTRFIGYLLMTWLGLAVVVEVVLRLAGVAPSPAAEVPEHYDPFQPDPDLIWSLKPGWRGFELNGAPVQINSLGLRGPEVPQSPADSTVRILFLGDSVAFGHGLAESFTISSQLQRQLNQQRQTGRRAEVLNAGVPGYSTFQSEQYYRLHGRLLKPHLVLLGFCFNDVTERYTTVANYGGRRIFMRSVDTSTELAWPQRVWQRTAMRQALVTLRRSSARQGERYRVTKLWTDATAKHIIEAWQRVDEEIDRLAQAVDESGARFAVVIFPYSFQLPPSTPGDGPQRRLIQHLESRGIHFVDLLPALKQTGGDPAAFFVDDNHFSSSGSAFVAAQIARFIEDADLMAE